MGNADVSDAAVKQITEMGFPEEQAIQALRVSQISSRSKDTNPNTIKATGGDVNEALNLIFQGADFSQGQELLQQDAQLPDYVDPGYNYQVDEKRSIPIESGLINDKIQPPSYEQEENPPPVPPRQNRPIHIEDIQHRSQSEVSLSDSGYLPDSETYKYQQQLQVEPEYSIYEDLTKYQKPDDAPSLLMPVRNGVLESYLNPFLTVLHSIPAFRKAVYNQTFETLGFHPRWYKGEPVNVPDGTSIKVKNGETHDLKFLLEVQRIFAFLDGDSGRYFASMNNFIRSFPKIAQKKFGSIDNIYEAYAVFYNVLASQLDVSGSGNALSFFESELEDLADANKKFGMFHVEAEELKGDLYSTLHSILWGDDLDNQQFLSKLSDVMTMSFEPSYDETIISKGVLISEKFYPQIYTTDFKETISELLEERNSFDKKKRLISRELLNLRAFNGKHVSSILSTSIEFLTSELKNLNEEDKELADAVKDLESIKADNHEKIISLTDKQNTLQDEKAKINPYDVNAIFKRHGSVPEPYLLTGVILSNNEFYFLRKVKEDLIDLEQNQNQWIRVLYEPKYGNDLRCSVSSFEEVQRVVHATTQGQYETSLVLIYVKESTWTTEVEYEVPESVTNFIAKDKLELEKSLELLASSTDEELSDEEGDEEEDGNGMEQSAGVTNQEGEISLKGNDENSEDKENAPPTY